MKRLTILFSTIAVWAVSGCKGKHIHTEISINAEPEVVYGVLADNARYPEWNPYHVRVEGALEIGNELQVEIHKPNGDTVNIHPKVMRIFPGRELTWGGGIKGIFFGEHVFLLEQTDTGGTHLIHKEDFNGIFVPFASLDAVEEGYNAMNHALKKRVEAMGKTKPHLGLKTQAIQD